MMEKKNYDHLQELILKHDLKSFFEDLYWRQNSMPEEMVEVQGEYEIFLRNNQGGLLPRNESQALLAKMESKVLRILKLLYNPNAHENSNNAIIKTIPNKDLPSSTADFAEIIDKYLNHEMSVEEKSEFEAHLLQNSKLNTSVEGFRGVLNGLWQEQFRDHPNWAGYKSFLEEEEHTFQNNLEQVQQALAAENFFAKEQSLPDSSLNENPPESSQSETNDELPSTSTDEPSLPPPNSGRVIALLSWRNLALIAASITLLFLAWRWFTPTQVDAEKLFASHFALKTQPAKDYLAEAGFGAHSAFDSLFRQAILFSERKNYVLAVETLQFALNQGDSTLFLFPFAQELLAELYLATQQTTKALPIFQELSQIPNFENRHLATYNLALAFLQQNQFAKAEQVLQTIPPEAEQYTAARELLKALP